MNGVPTGLSYEISQCLVRVDLIVVVGSSGPPCLETSAIVTPHCVVLSPQECRASHSPIHCLNGENHVKALFVFNYSDKKKNLKQIKSSVNVLFIFETFLHIVNYNIVRLWLH